VFFRKKNAKNIFKNVANPSGTPAEPPKPAQDHWKSCCDVVGDKYLSFWAMLAHFAEVSVSFPKKNFFQKSLIFAVLTLFLRFLAKKIFFQKKNKKTQI
jgi:hypothetical protein